MRGNYPEMVPAPLAYSVSRAPVSPMELEKLDDSNKQCCGKCMRHLDCHGHIAVFRGNMVYPTALSMPHSGICNKLSLTRHNYIEGRGSHSEHLDALVSTLRTKHGILRGSVTSMVVEGSVRMVIVPRACNAAEDENTVGVPEFVANSMVIPFWNKTVKTGNCGHRVLFRPLLDGDKAILIRYPTLWSGGMLPVTVKVESHRDSIRSSISVPIEMTKSYNADFDGDEVVLIPLASPEAVAECSAITTAVKKPFHNRLRSGNVGSFTSWDRNSFLFRSTMTARELCEVLQREEDLSDYQVASGMTRATAEKFIDYAYSPRPLDVVFENLVSNSRSFVRKAGGQSGTGYNTRALRTFGSYCTMSLRDSPSILGMKSASGPINIQTFPLERCRFSYGFPGIRALSKLGQKMMQSTLSKKDGLVVSETCLDPVMEIISGKVTKTLLFLKESLSGEPKAVAVPLLKNIGGHSAIYATCSPTILAQIEDRESRRYAACNGAKFLTCHIGCNLDEDEMLAVVEILMFLSYQPIKRRNILSLFKHWTTACSNISETNGRILPIMHGSWYSKRMLKMLDGSKRSEFLSPTTMFGH